MRTTSRIPNERKKQGAKDGASLFLRRFALLKARKFNVAVEVAFKF